MDDKIIIDRMDAEEFLSMLTDAAMQGDNVTQYYSTTQIIENIANVDVAVKNVLLGFLNHFAEFFF